MPSVVEISMTVCKAGERTEGGGVWGCKSIQPIPRNPSTPKATDLERHNHETH